MSQSALADTLRQIERLSEGPLHEAPAPETRRHAADFLTRFSDALPGGAESWEAPTVEVGGGGVVVLLWEDGQRGLSVSVGPDGAGAWVCEPGVPDGAVMSLNVAERVFGGSAGPQEFARDVWTPWARGEAPFA